MYKPAEGGALPDSGNKPGMIGSGDNTSPADYVMIAGTERTESGRGSGLEKHRGLTGGTLEDGVGDGLCMNVPGHMSDNLLASSSLDAQSLNREGQGRATAELSAIARRDAQGQAEKAHRASMRRASSLYRHIHGHLSKPKPLLFQQA